MVFKFKISKNLRIIMNGAVKFGMKTPKSSKFDKLQKLKQNFRKNYHESLLKTKKTVNVRIAFKI